MQPNYMYITHGLILVKTDLNMQMKIVQNSSISNTTNIGI